MSRADIKALVQTFLTGGAIAIAAFVDATWKPYAVIGFAVVAFAANRWGVFSRELRLSNALDETRNATFQWLAQKVIDDLEREGNLQRAFRATLFLRRDYLWAIGTLKSVTDVGWSGLDRDKGIAWWSIAGIVRQGLIWSVAERREYGSFFRSDGGDPRQLFGLSGKQVALTERVVGIVAFPVRRADNGLGGRTYAVISIDALDEQAASRLRQVANEIEGNPEHPIVILVDRISRFIV